MEDSRFFLTRFRELGASSALASRGKILSYAELLELVEAKILHFEKKEIGLGSPTILLGDFSFESVASLLALIARRAIAIPLLPNTYRSLGNQLNEVEPEFLIDCRNEDVSVTRLDEHEPNQLYRILSERQTCGLVLFTSGSTGRPKAVVHDFSRLLRKFQRLRPAMSAVNFLLFDHWGGINTLMGSLANGGLMVFPESRNPDEICSLIEKHRIELLPTTPSFLNLLLISRSYQKFDLSSLRLITYGAETMPDSTLRRLHQALPQVELRQTYGMIELGVMRAKSMSSDSLWVRIGGEGYDLRVVDGILQVKAEAAMLGYLNAPSPFTEDGYFITGDRVEQRGDYFKILGRDSDIINVGGQKVYPAEVEAVILEVPQVIDAVVYAEKHVLTGSIVSADLIVAEGAEKAKIRQDVKKHCADALQPFMVPVRINFPSEGIYTARLKRRRDR
jgi:long-chain acyl-CoA synthetase